MPSWECNESLCIFSFFLFQLLITKWMIRLRNTRLIASSISSNSIPTVWIEFPVSLSPTTFVLIASISSGMFLLKWWVINGELFMETVITTKPKISHHLSLLLLFPLFLPLNVTSRPVPEISLRNLSECEVFWHAGCKPWKPTAALATQHWPFYTTVVTAFVSIETPTIINSYKFSDCSDSSVAEWSALPTSNRGVPCSIPAQVKSFFEELRD